MNTIKTFFMGSIIFTIVSVMLGFGYGTYLNHTIVGGVSIAITMLILGILEISMSFDNAIVNAKTLNSMNDVWRHRFLTWGMIIAVFGMRIIFPILVVSIFGNVSIPTALSMAVSHPEEYAKTLEDCHVLIAGFGGTFLLLVALKFFFDAEKEHHWLKPIEKWLSNAGHVEAVELIVTLAIIVGISYIVPIEVKSEFLIASMAGIICHEVIHGIAEALNTQNSKNVAAGVVKGGIMSFLYLEVLDASFSFDGVVGAFVLSNNIFVIALGLGIGAMFVRSLTIMFVEKKTLSEFKYLEHGAFWSILILACIMFTSIRVDIPEWITGILSISFIGASVVASIIHNKKEGSNGTI